MRRLALLFVLLPFATTAMAQEDAGNRQIKYKERTEIDFEKLEIFADKIEGGDIILVDEVGRRPEFSFIELRHDFNAEMSASIDQVK